MQNLFHQYYTDLHELKENLLSRALVHFKLDFEEENQRTRQYYSVCFYPRSLLLNDDSRIVLGGDISLGGYPESQGKIEYNRLTHTFKRVRFSPSSTKSTPINGTLRVKSHPVVVEELMKLINRCKQTQSII